MHELRSPAEVGAIIAAERNAFGLSQNELAERVGITRERLAGYEKGRGCLRCGIVFEICRSLVLNEAWLATGEDDKDCYLDIGAYFPSKLSNKPFLELYKSHIEPIYNKITHNDPFYNLLRYDDIHPDTLRIACFKILKQNARHVHDDESLSHYWREIGDCSFEKCLRYSKAPRTRLAELNTKISIARNGEEVPFSYEKFFDDLSLIGLKSHEIENLAENLIRPPEIKKHVLPAEKIQEEVLRYLEVCELSNALVLYRKIHCKDQ